MLGGPPPYGEGEWPAERVQQWVERSMEWIHDVAGPESTIAVAALHQDETAPHLHIVFVPVSAARGLGWTARQAEFLRERGYPKGALKQYGGVYQLLHSDYAKRVGVEFGLARGEPMRQTGATPEAIDRGKAVQATREREEYYARVARAEAERSKEAAEESDKRRRRDDARARDAADRLYSSVESSTALEKYRDQLQQHAEARYAEEQEEEERRTFARAAFEKETKEWDYLRRARKEGPGGEPSPLEKRLTTDVKALRVENRGLRADLEIAGQDILIGDEKVERVGDAVYRQYWGRLLDVCTAYIRVHGRQAWETFRQGFASDLASLYKGTSRRDLEKVLQRLDCDFAQEALKRALER